MALVLPLLNVIRERANTVRCQNNIAQLMKALQVFAAEHDGALPGGKHDTSTGLDGGRYPPQPLEQRDWLARDGLNTPPQSRDPRDGTLFKYVRDAQAYTCPTLADTPIYGAGAGTNTRFDYSIFSIWPGAKLDMIKPQSFYTYAGQRYVVPTPIIVQEQLTSINRDSIEGGHSNTDKFSHAHKVGRAYGSYYGAIDGSAQFINEPRDNNCWNWFTWHTPSNGYRPMGDDFGWGMFNGTWPTWASGTFLPK